MRILDLLRPERVYWLVVAPATLALVFLIAPLHGPDEPAHLYRADGLSNGSVFPRVVPTTTAYGAAGGDVDAVLRAWVLRVAPGDEIEPKPARAYLSEPPEYADGNKVPVPYSNTVIYPPFLYVSSTAAIALARAAHWPVMTWIYAARLANALTAMAVIGALMRCMPALRPTILVFAALPIVFFQSGTVAIDAILLPVVIAFACLLATLFSLEANRRIVTVALIVATGLLCVGKVAYLPFAVLPPLAARAADGCWSRRSKLLVAASIVTVVAWAAWAWIIHDKVYTIRQFIPVDPIAQLHFVLSHPVQAAVIFGRSVLINARWLVSTSIGSHLGNFNLRLWHPPIFLGLAVLLATSARPTTTFVPRWFSRVVVVTGLVVSAAIVLLLYLQFNPVGQPVVEGLQGRYFLPSVILAIVFSPLVSRTRKSDWFDGLAIVFPFVTVATVLLASRQYWSP